MTSGRLRVYGPGMLYRIVNPTAVLGPDLLTRPASVSPALRAYYVGSDCGHQRRRAWSAGYLGWWDELGVEGVRVPEREILPAPIPSDAGELALSLDRAHQAGWRAAALRIRRRLGISDKPPEAAAYGRAVERDRIAYGRRVWAAELPVIRRRLSPPAPLPGVLRDFEGSAPAADDLEVLAALRRARARAERLGFVRLAPRRWVVYLESADAVLATELAWSEGDAAAYRGLPWSFAGEAVAAAVALLEEAVAAA